MGLICRNTSISFHSTPREWPVPSAFIAASFAAKRPARLGTGSRCRCTIGDLDVGEDAPEEALAIPLEYLAHAREVGGVDAETDDCHGNNDRSQAYRRLRVDARAGGRALRCSRLPAPHVFTSRDLQLRDDQGEWAAVAGSLRVSTDRLLLVKQVHGTQVAVARRGRAAAWMRAEADIIVSDDPEVAIGVRVADCAPVLLFDAKRKVAGAVHAGWRGAAAGAAPKGVAAMTREFQSNPADILVAIGPCLGQCCGRGWPRGCGCFSRGRRRRGLHRRLVQGGEPGSIVARSGARQSGAAGARRSALRQHLRIGFVYEDLSRAAALLSGAS